MEKIRIFIDNNNNLVEENYGTRTTTPIQNKEFAWFKFEDGTRLVFIKRKEHWCAEIEQTTIKSEYSIQRTKNSCSDIFFTNFDIKEKEILVLRENDE